MQRTGCLPTGWICTSRKMQQIYAVGDSGGACLLTYCTAMQNSKKVAAAAHVTPSALPIQALG